MGRTAWREELKADQGGGWGVQEARVWGRAGFVVPVCAFAGREVGSRPENPGCQGKDWKAMGLECMGPSSSDSQSFQNPAAPLCTPSPDTQGLCPEAWTLLQGSERCLAHQLPEDVDGSGTDGASHLGGPWSPHLLPSHHTQRPDRSSHLPRHRGCGLRG